MTSQQTQANKALVWRFWQELDTADAAESAEIVADYMTPDVDWLGCHPFNRITAPAELARRYWQPLRTAFPDLRRECYIFMGGGFTSERPEDNAANFGEWVCATGDLTGTFVYDWLGIPATGRKERIRFGEFCRVENGRIIGGRVILDLVDFLRDAGFRILPPAPGAEIVIPGPSTDDGILLRPQEDAASAKSLTAVDRMLFKGLMAYDQAHISSMRNDRFWTPDMLWYGPGGIGTTYGIQGFQEQHQRPFLRAFPDRKGGHHDARIAEGMYVASTGWPSLLATHQADYLGAPATHQRIGMRVMDWWRRDGDMLVENWVFIDMLDLFLQFGQDLLGDLLAERQF